MYFAKGSESDVKFCKKNLRQFREILHFWFFFRETDSRKKCSQKELNFRETILKFRCKS